MLLGEGGTHGGYHVVKSRLMEGNDVDVALNQHQVGPLGILGQVQGINQPALVEHHGLGGIEVLGPLLPRQNPAGKARHLTPHVDDGEHEPGAELIVHAAVFPGYCQAGVNQLHFAETPGCEGFCQGVPAVRGGTQAEPHGIAAADPPLGDIVLDPLPAGAVEILVIKPGGLLIGLQNPGPLLPPCLVGAGVRHLQTRPLGQQPHRVGEDRFSISIIKEITPPPLPQPKQW